MISRTCKILGWRYYTQALHCTNIVHLLLHDFAARFTGLLSYLSSIQLYKITHSMTGTISFSRQSWYKEFTKPKMSKEYTDQLQNSIHGGESMETSDNITGNRTQRAQLQDISKALLLQVRLIQA